MNEIQAYKTAPELGLADIARALWRRKWIILIIMATSLGAAAYATSKMKSRYKATAQMIVIQRGATISTSAEASYTAPLVESPDTQVEMIMSGSMAQRTLDWLRNDAAAKRQTVEQLGFPNIDEIEKQLPSLITVQVPKETSLLILNATAPSADQAANLANAVCKAFVEWKKEIAQSSVREMMRSLEERARRANTQMLRAEQAETDFKRSHQLVDVPSQHKAELDQYLQFDLDVTKYKQELVSQEEKAKALNTQLKSLEGVIRGGTGIRDDALAQDLQKQLNSLEIERATQALKVTPEFPGVLPDLDARIKDIQDRLTKAVQGTLDNKRPSLSAQDQLRQNYNQAQIEMVFTRAKLNAAIKVRDQNKRLLAGIPMMGMEYARLARQAEMSRQLYSSLQSSLNTVKLSKDSVDGNVRITSVAFPPERPFYPERSRNLLLGGVLGLGLAVPLALLLESSNGRTRNAGEIKRLAQGQVIGILPRLSRSQIRQIEAGTEPPMAKEIFSMARANLAMIARENPKDDFWTNQIIMITSAIPGEGKSLTAANFARTIARTGKTVILIDADMRRPSQSKFFLPDSDYGLADVLNANMPVEEALSATEVENLYVLHSGKTLRNPTELISQPRMIETLQACQELVDVVIIDTPACAIVAEALLLAPYMNCIIQVVGVGKAESDLVRETMHTLRGAGCANMVLFINLAQREARHAHSKYYAKYDDIPLIEHSSNGNNGNGNGTASGRTALPVKALATDVEEREEEEAS